MKTNPVMGMKTSEKPGKIIMKIILQPRKSNAYDYYNLQPQKVEILRINYISHLHQCCLSNSFFSPQNQ